MMTTAISSSFSTSTIEAALSYAASFQKSCGFIVVVLDHMSDQQSHIANLTSQLYPILKKNVRVTDTIIRFTPDSWVICLDDCNDHLLRWTCYGLESSIQRGNMQISRSLDNALTMVRGSFLVLNSLNQALKAFEHEIQSAKSNLRRLRRIRSTALNLPESLPAKQANLVALIHHAVLENRLFLAFQPIVYASSQKIHHYECLARILDQEGQMIPAGQFISLCEKTGLIHLIDQKIQQLALEELMNDRDVCLAINVSAITASDPIWLNTLKAQITARPDLRGRLIVELTETAVFQDINESVEFITQLRNLGCEVSIDDFGAGYMSVKHLQSDLIQTVKIDAQFVKDLHSDSNHIHFNRAIMTLTQPYGIKCIAEGVENAEAANILVQENIDYLQGYYIGKPCLFRKWLS